MKSNKIFFLICCLIIQSFQSNAQQDFTTKKSVQKNTKASVISLIGPHLESALKKSIEDINYKNSLYLPATCFAPDTDPRFLEEFYRTRSSYENSLGFLNPNSRYNLAGRWSSTATNGNGLEQGDITTLTWSYVADGTPIGNGGCGLPDIGGNSDFISFFNNIYGAPTIAGDFTTAPWHQIFIDMFNSWSVASGLIFVYETNDDGATVVTGGSGQVGLRGDVRISGHPIDGNSGVLACNYYPQNGDMIIDTADNYYSNNPGTGTTNVLTHEIGHGVGLAHVCPVNQTKLMEPFVNTAFVGPQEDDILATNRHYGDVEGENGTPGTSSLLGSNANPTSYEVLQRSIDDVSDIDYYSFNITEPSELTGILTPTGTTYLEGVQLGDGSCSAGTNFNAQIISDIKIEVLDTDGASILAAGDTNGAGIPETISSLSLVAPGTYYVRISQQGTVVNDVQMYDLDLSLTSGNCFINDGNIQAAVDLWISDPTTAEATYGNISNWDTSCVTDMSGLFSAGNFNDDISQWDVSNVTSMDNMLSGSAISIANYDAILQGWAAQTVQNNINLGAGGLFYCNAEAERQSLIDNFGWTISDGGLDPNCSPICEVEIIASATEICAGESVGLTVSGDENSSYLWSTLETGSLQETLVDEYSLVANTVSQNTFSVIPGTNYRLEITGTISVGAGAGNQRDAAYFIQTGPPNVIEGTPYNSPYSPPLPEYVNYIWTSLTLENPGLRPTPDIYDPVDHTYSYPFTPTTTNIDVGFYDSPIGDNQATVVTFKLYQISSSSSITVTPSETTEYWVDATTNGVTCRDYITINVINPEITASATEICAGESVDLSVNTLDANDVCDLPVNLEEGVVMYLPFCDNAQDISGNSNDGVVSNSNLTEDRFNNPNQAYLFSNSSQSMITVNPSSSLNITQDITFSAWFYPTDTSLGYIVDRDVCGFTGDWGLQWLNGQVKMRTQGDENTIVSGVLAINNWYHVLVTRESGVFTMYINSEITSQNSGYNYNFVNTNNPIRIGDQSCTSPEENFDGKIDDVAIWNRALSSEEVLSLYQNTPSITTSYLWSTGDTTENITVTPTETTEYWVDVTTNGVTCRDYITINVINPEITASATEICVGESVDLSVASDSSSGSEGQLIDELNHTITSDIEQAFATTLGLNYRLEISGLATWGTYCPALANDPAYVLDGFYGAVGAIPRDFECNDVMFSSIFCEYPGLRPIPDEYDDENHSYDYYFTANTNEIIVGFSDSPDLGDNCGSITFKLYENSTLYNTSYLWSTGDTTENISVIPTETTEYWVDVTTNGVTCREYITINVDAEDPTWIFPPSDLTVECDGAGNTTEFNNWLNNIFTGTDNCGEVIISNNSSGLIDACGGTGSETVTFTLTDSNNNSISLDATFTIEDTTAPVIFCPDNLTAFTEDVNCGAIVFLGDPIAIEECGSVIVYQTAGLDSGSVFPVGDTIIEFTAEDECGNIATCEFIVTVIDNDAPEAICQDLTVILDDTGNATITADQLNFGSNDNCGVESLAIDVDTFDCSNVGANQVTLTVTDIHGNTATCVSTVTVLDNTAPIAVCQDITLELGDDGTVTIDPLAIDGGSSDACGIASYELDIDTLDCSNLGTTTVTLTVTDTNGNQSSCAATVTLEDNSAPVLVCSDVTVELNQDGVALITPSLVADITDNCGTSVVTINAQEVSCADIGTPLTVTVFASDENGNSASCSAVVTVVDLLAPEIVCPDDQVVNLGPDGTYTLGDYIADGSATATDNCTDPVTIFAQDPAAGSVLGFGTQEITFTAEDQYGNVSTCSFELDIQVILGAGDVEDFASLVLYPNPAGSKVNLSNPRQIDLNNVTIYDLTGRIVHKVDLSTMGSEITIDISTLANATYMLVIEGSQGISTKQLIVNN